MSPVAEAPIAVTTDRRLLRGERTIVKIDPRSHRPAPWTNFFRDRHITLLKDLSAYA